MKILLVNDDGIEAEGILTLAECLSEKHEIYIAAPMHQMSCYSHSVTYFRQINKAVKRDVPFAEEAWAIEATPADCTYYALNGLLGIEPDLVISGINHGPNMSSDAIYSGTIGAASEGMINGVPSMAVSLCANHGVNFKTAAVIAAEAAELFMNDPHRYTYILGINVPDLELDQLKGIRITHFAGTLDYRRRIKAEKQHNDTYLLDLAENAFDPHKEAEDPAADTTAVNNGYVSFTPLYNDICRHDLEKGMQYYCSIFQKI